MSNSNTEEIGINDLRALLLRTHVVATDKVTICDKGISWDGYLQVFKNESGTKSSLFGNIPVQVKTIHEEKNVNRFPISRKDLENYKKENRVMYFYITLDKRDRSTIFYLDLQLWDIETKIREICENESKVFTFKRFPKKSKDIIDLLYRFIIESDQQKVLMPGIYSYRDLVKEKGDVPVSFDIMVPRGTSLLKVPALIKEQEPYIKYTSEDTKLDYVVDRLRSSNNFTIKLNEFANVGFKDVTVYNRVSIEGNEESFKIICSPSLIISIKEKEITFKYNFSLGIIDDKCLLSSFLERLCKESAFYLNDIKVSLNKEQMAVLYERARRNIFFYSKYDLLRKKLHITKEPVFDNCTENELEQFSMLCISVLDGKAIPKVADNNGIAIFSIFGIHLLMCVVSNENQSLLFNWCDERIKLQSSESGESLSPYYFLESQETNWLLKMDNIDLSQIESQLFECDITEARYKHITNVVVNLVGYYDQTKDDEALNVALNISNRLISIDSKDVSSLLNHTQVLVRQNKSLGAYEQIIKEISNEFSDNFIVSFACYTVLRQMDMATNYLNKIDEKQLLLVKKWPIFTLYLNLSSVGSN